jgi:hypothetical protein
MSEDMMTREERRALVALLDTLLPGGEGFPAASASYMVDLFASRLLAVAPEAMAQIIGLVDTGSGLPGDAAGWQAAAYRIEVILPRLFGEFRKQAYLAYYEQPAVITAIRALGITYNDAPLPEGYPQQRFEPARDTPTHGRGTWLRTDEITRVDLSNLNLGDLLA